MDLIIYNSTGIARNYPGSEYARASYTTYLLPNETFHELVYNNPQPYSIFPDYADRHKVSMNDYVVAMISYEYYYPEYYQKETEGYVATKGTGLFVILPTISVNFGGNYVARTTYLVENS